MRAYPAVLGLMLLAATWAAGAHADELLMVRINRAFPETMARLQDSIASHGYTISRVQRVDVGLKANGFATAPYRVVFFGKPDEMRELPLAHPAIAAYLPLQIVIFAERDDTLVLTADPLKLATFFPQPDLQPHFAAWARDVRAIFSELRHSDD